MHLTGWLMTTLGIVFGVVSLTDEAPLLGAAAFLLIVAGLVMVANGRDRAHSA